MKMLNLTHTGTQEIETGRLLLRRFVMSDANEIFREWMSYENISKYMRWEYHKSISETKTFLMNTIAGYEQFNTYQWGIELKNEGILIGAIGANIYSERDRNATVGYCLGERFWNRGYATEALRAVMDYMFYDVNVNRVEGCSSINNPASGKVMQKAGLIKEGTIRQEYMTGEGEYQDVDLYGLVKEDFEKLYEPEIKDFLDLREMNLSAYSLSLKCSEYYEGDIKKNHVPAYNFDIIEKNSDMVCGEISLRLGFTEGLYYGGHIGYTVNEDYRNMGVATVACGIILELVRAHGFKKIIITNNHTNKASRRVCEKIGARLVRIAKLPQWHDLYIIGQRYECIYELDFI